MKLIIRLLAAALAYALGEIITGALNPVLHLPVVALPASATAQRLVLHLLLTAPLLTFALAPLALGIRGSWTQRWLALSLLLYVTLGLNNMIELKIFSTMLAGSALAASLHSVLPTALAAAVICLPSGRREGTSTMGSFGPAGWSWRLVAAWLALPVFYLMFGMLVAPFVVGHYQAGELGLRIPPISVILRTVILRSAIYLAASMPAIMLWRKSRTQFILAMGLAQAFAIGVFPLAQTYFLPTVLRVAHSIEITADSFAYATILGLLFVGSERASAIREPQLSAATSGD